MIDAKKIDAVLPQTQCGECSYAGCLPYAEALAAGSATIDRCPPGGVQTVQALGALLGIDSTPYLAQAEANTRSPAIAVIREAECIGCTKCITACPVDAIIGSGKLMHAVISHDCTGCGLCVAPCPVDCIEMQVQPAVTYDPAKARARFQARQTRLLRVEHQKQQSYRQKQLISSQNKNAQKEKTAKLDYILQAVTQVKVRKNVNLTQHKT